MNPRPLIYVAGPYTSGDTALHCARACKVGEGLYERGFLPHIPHLTHLWHLTSPHDVEYWYELDNHYLPRCDAMVRLKGASKGADAEEALAVKLGMLVIEIEDVTESELDEAADLLRASFDRMPPAECNRGTTRYFYVVEAASGPYDPSEMFEDLEDAEKHARDRLPWMIEAGANHPAAPTFVIFYEVGPDGSVKRKTAIYGTEVNRLRAEVLK